MDFYAVLDQVVELVRSRGRVSYQALKLNFDLDDTHFQALKEELLFAHEATIRDEGSGFTWADQTTSLRYRRNRNHRRLNADNSR